MSTNTTNYNLKKPGVDDFYNVADQNGNMEIIDIALGNKVEKIVGKGLSTNDYTTLEKDNLTDLTDGTDTSLHTHATSGITGFAEAVRGMVLTGLSTATNAVITAADTVLSALGKLQKQITDHKTDYTLQVPYGGTTTGTANTYVLATPTITALSAGMAVSVKFNLDSTAASTLNWCALGAKPIKKANGTSVTNLKATGIYTLRYDGTNFILQGEGASGDATASDLISGKTATVDAGEITGTLVLTGTAVAADILVAKTAYNTDPKNVITGTLALTGNAGVSDVVNGKTFYSADAKVKLTGTNTNKKWASGSLTPTQYATNVVTGLGFTPSVVLIKLLNSSYFVGARWGGDYTANAQNQFGNNAQVYISALASGSFSFVTQGWTYGEMSWIAFE